MLRSGSTLKVKVRMKVVGSKEREKSKMTPSFLELSVFALKT